jgi:hypothetical protein
MPKKLTLKHAQDLAKSRGGECLSTEYKNTKTLMSWLCEYGHQFIATYNSLRTGSWCKECASMLSERICRLYLELLFTEKFMKQRPDCLRTEGGGRLELDGYCNKLGIGFEHNGDQHNKSVKYYGGQEAFEKLKIRDQNKIRLCEKNGIKLIIIPQLFTTIKLNDLSIFVYNELIRLDIKIPNNFYKININDIHLYSNKIDEMKEIANKKGGILLSDFYVHDKDKLKWCCSEKHIWTATPHDIKDGTWCPECAKKIIGDKNRKYTIEDMKEIAIQHNGKCLSSSYKTIEEFLEWQCENNHIWSAPANNIKNMGHWCPTCAGNQKKNIKDMQRVAFERNGECLSIHYTNNSTQLSWKCSKNHIWTATPCNIVNRNSWCPECAAIARGAARKGKKNKPRTPKQ